MSASWGDANGVEFHDSEDIANGEEQWESQHKDVAAQMHCVPKDSTSAFERADKKGEQYVLVAACRQKYKEGKIWGNGLNFSIFFPVIFFFEPRQRKRHEAPSKAIDAVHYLRRICQCISVGIRGGDALVRALKVRMNSGDEQWQLMGGRGGKER